jgi:alanine-synthesizing transaminase
MTRFSRRLDWSLTENALAQAISARRAARLPLLDLTESNPTRAGLPYPARAIAEALADDRAAVYQPAPRGLEEARAAVAAYYAARGRPVDPERLLLTASTSEAYAWLFKLLADPGDDFAVPHPSYPLFDFLAGLESVHLTPYQLRYDGAWYLDLDSLRAAIGPRTRAILLVNPNNPTGSFLTRDELAALTELARERELALIADEVFSDYAFAPDPARVDTLVGADEVLSFSLSGLSKVVGLPQLKLGWIHLGGPPAARAAAAERLELIADTYLSVGAPVQLAAARLLALRPQLAGAIAARVAENHAQVRGSVAGTAVELLAAGGGWYAVLRLPRTRPEEQWAIDLVREAGVVTQPGYFFDFSDEAYLVVSLLTPVDTLALGVRAILEIAAR